MRRQKSKEETIDNTMQSLQIIPGVGPKLAQIFLEIGLKRIPDLKGKNTEELYSRICARQGIQIDRCVLYVCRSSVYIAETENPDPEKLQWWYWKDKKDKSQGKVTAVIIDEHKGINLTL